MQKERKRMIDRQVQLLRLKERGKKKKKVFLSRNSIKNFGQRKKRKNKLIKIHDIIVTLGLEGTD